MDDSPRPGCFTRFISLVLVVALLTPMLLGAAALGSTLLVRASLPDARSEAVIQVAAEVILARVDESPAVEPVPVTYSPAPGCPRIEPIWRGPMLEALALMRGTDEGERLYQTLIDSDVCFRVENLDFNSGYTSYFVRGQRVSDLTITVDSDLVRGSRVDVLAALLIHEATHVERAVSGTACWWDDACVELSNGVLLDEEVEAHGAEARWWIEAFGTDGKAFAVHIDAGENALANAYLQGEEVFRAYVRGFRSDPREGADFDEGGQ